MAVERFFYCRKARSGLAARETGAHDVRSDLQQFNDDERLEKKFLFLYRSRCETSFEKWAETSMNVCVGR